MAKLSSSGAKAKVSSAKAPKVSPKSPYDEFAQSSSDYTLSDTIINLYGNRGVGKTFMAASASKHWRSSNGMRELKDMLWISADAGATDGFASQGIKVPEIRLIDLVRDAKKWRAAGFQKVPSITEAASWAAGYAAERVQNGLTEWV